ncbi:MAG: alpha/beta fold hydrolase [Alphaproteobacteria bacterium]|nr:alpha/beta fold hydrolase [Alphaproteobacteria bacterium]MCB9695886.1 alpha/beta fold hydrolase [Alphaproteobacteria bacterium]
MSVPDAELVWVDVGEGHQAALHHTPREGAPPVVLCHGISSNHRFWDLEPGRSLVEALWDEGFDVWNLDLRGHGDAVRDEEGRRQRPDWSVDDYGTGDLPAVFDLVLERTGAAELSYVGHSMGGMVLAVYLATHPDPPLSSAVVVGSPLDFRDPDALLALALGTAGPARGLRFVPTPAGAKVLAITRRDTVSRVDELLHNPENLDPKAEARMFRAVVSPMSRGELQQFSHARDGEFRSADGSTVWRQRLGDVDVPMLFVAGRADRVANPDRVWSYYDAVGTDDKAFVVVSRANGFHGDYGHLDLGVGDHAGDDVFPLVTTWLAGHGSVVP